MATTMFSIDQMHCGSCVRRVSDVLRAVPGVTLKSVEVGSAEVEYESAVTSPTAVVAALTAAGYPARTRNASISLIAPTNVAGNGGGCKCG